MELVRGRDRTIVRLEAKNLVGEGGEAKVVGVLGDRDLVAKIYHKPNQERAAKLRAMLASPPSDPTASQGHVSIAWPVDVLLDPATGDTVGFLMRRSPIRDTVFSYYNPGERRKRYPLFNYDYLLGTAFNIATVVQALHERGYVVGDVNQGNILVDSSARVTVVDTDSFQVRDAASQRVFRCTVYTPEFTPPELQGRDLTQIDRTPQHDAFGLGVLLFHLLMEGAHPFVNCVYKGQGEPPEVVARIQAGHFPYSQSRAVPWVPAPGAVPFEVLDGDLRGLLLQCFDAGHGDPQARPSARQWCDTLRAASKRMKTCGVNAQHRFGGHLPSCPWCERSTRMGGRDPFPSRADVLSGAHLAQVARRTPAPPVPPVPPVAPQPVATPQPSVVVPPAWPGGAIAWVLARTWAWGGLVAAVGVLFIVYGLLRSTPASAPSTSAEPAAATTPKVVRVTPPNAITNPVDGQVYVWVPPGKFTMGCSEGDTTCYDAERPAHPVTISKGFHLGQTEVTQAAYQKVIGSNPSNSKGDDLPVEEVSWNDADAYCKKVGGRLPTEAEWEYAARAGSAASAYGTLKEIAWFSENSGSKTHPVATLGANAFGLHDMLGNVREWTADWYGPYAAGNATDPKGPQSGSQKALRGGSFDFVAGSTRASFRSGFEPANRDSGVGFRCARE